MALSRGARPGILAGALVAFLGFEGCLGERSAGGWVFWSVCTSAGLILGASVGLRGGGAPGARGKAQPPPPGPPGLGELHTCLATGSSCAPRGPEPHGALFPGTTGRGPFGPPSLVSSQRHPCKTQARRSTAHGEKQVRFGGEHSWGLRRGKSQELWVRLWL